MLISLLVPSHGRPAALARCLAAVASQTRAAAQLVVVLRAGDAAGAAAARNSGLALELVEVSGPGQVRALNAGLARCRGEIVAITDDDAAPRPDWLARIARHFEQAPGLGAVGGRDFVHRDGQVVGGPGRQVGRVLWFGRVAGNHHCGAGAARAVDFLKGANCAFRMAALRPIGFEPRLRGAGAQVHNDMLACLAVKRAGWTVVYDPAVAVDHYPGPRADAPRGVLAAAGVYDAAFNFELATGLLSRRRRRAARAWGGLVGSGGAPGVLGGLRLAGELGFGAWPLVAAAAAGRRAARAMQSPRGWPA